MGNKIAIPRVLRPLRKEKEKRGGRVSWRRGGRRGRAGPDADSDSSRSLLFCKVGRMDVWRLDEAINNFDVSRGMLGQCCVSPDVSVDGQLIPLQRCERDVSDDDGGHNLA